MNNREHQARTARGWVLALRTHSSLKEQIFFAKRLSFLLHAGIPLIESLTILRAQAIRPAQTRAYDAVLAHVTEGRSLAASLGAQPGIMNDFGIELIKIGELSGLLADNLKHLAHELTKRDALRTKVASALLYPTFITLATLAVTIFLTLYIFPKIIPIFTSLHVTLPLTTRILLWVTVFLQDWGMLLLLAIVSLGILFFVLRQRNAHFRYRTDHTLIGLPFFGPIEQQYALANASRTLGLLLESGVPIPIAVETVASASSNRAYRAAYQEASTRILQGERLSRALANYPRLYPATHVQLLAIGEAGGGLSRILLELAELHESDVEERTKVLASSIEPLLMLVMGLLVGLIAVSVITPIYGITQHIGGR